MSISNARMRSGSALLMVLGMVAFMVVSAVGFSVYMRQNRRPSSFLRRRTTSRELLRASLAEAMSAVDSAMRSAGNAPAPGIGGTENMWLGRVFCPGGMAGLVDSIGTASPLALESLAYLPPALVNDVRYYSRRSPTCAWSRFDFDAGRASYCIVNVSDYFDINHARADMPRNSSDAGLVPMSYLFLDENYSGLDGSLDPVKFQEFLDQVTRSDLPFVSIADYNLALDSLGSSCGLKSPFVEYLRNGSGGDFYGNIGTDESDSGFRAIATQRFVTDTCSTLDREEWLDKEIEKFDISTDEGQPFPQILKKGRNDDNLTASDLFSNGGNKFWDKYVDYFDPMEMEAMCDYLDANDVPISVVAPTVERTPMIVGVMAQADDLKLSLKSVSHPVEDVENPQGSGVHEVRRTYEYYLAAEGMFEIGAGFVYPFKYQQERDSDARFKAYAQAAFYMIPDSSVATPGGSREKGCVTKNAGPFASWPAKETSGGTEMRDGCAVLRAEGQAVGIPSGGVDTPNKAVSMDVAELKFSGIDSINSQLQNQFVVKYHTYEKYHMEMRNGVPTKVPDVSEDLEENIPDLQNPQKTEFNLKYLDIPTGEMKTIALNHGEKKEFTWGIAATVTLRDKNGKLVDMVPAHPSDDDTPNQPFGENDDASSLSRGILRFDGTNLRLVLENTIGGCKQLEQDVADNKYEEIKMTPAISAYLTDDPRYNFAASNWYPADVPDGKLGEAWLKGVTCNGQGGKDGDIFMAVSNQGYLQDAGEIAFLPRVCDFQRVSPSCESITRAINSDQIPSNVNSCRNSSQMWRTFGCFGKLGKNAEVDQLGMTCPVSGPRVNPYTDDDKILLGAFVNTPYDWWAAGTNANDTVKSGYLAANGRVKDKGALVDALKYAFSENGEGPAKVTIDKMEEIAFAAGDTFRGETDKKWYKAWQDMWDGGAFMEALTNAFGDKLHDVDRKFLYCYWRKCFANRQQLFLVFFRAEPVVLGGGAGAGSTPAQLGAKGVAVVWRNPDGPSDRPHAMRVLFYHQVK